MFENAQGSIDVMGLVGRFATGDSTTNQAAAAQARSPSASGARSMKRAVARRCCSLSAGAVAAGLLPPPRRAQTAPAPATSRAAAGRRRPQRRDAPPPPPAPPPGGTVLMLRGLDKITGRPTNIVAPIGKPVHFATLTITARYLLFHARQRDAGNHGLCADRGSPPRPAGAKRVFSGWMYASSPGLNGVEHPLYDVWVISCNNAPAPAVAVNTSTAPVKVAAPDSSDKEGIEALPEDAGR